MGHYIQAIVAPVATADAICREWPELPRLNRGNGFAILPIEADLMDERIAPDATPAASDDEFVLLTNGFRSLLSKLSRGGLLAYVETEYFGGVGGQGALVCRDGEEIMPPTWETSNIINCALRLIGLKRGLFQDEFEAVGFGDVRSNDDISEMIAKQRKSE